MKFGHEYKKFLENGGFPAGWAESAISYQQLKKCIKKVKQELASLGLDTETLQHLLNRANDASISAENEKEQAAVYEFERDEDEELSRAESRPAPMRPKLLFVIDKATGEPIDASLSSETKRYIHELALNARLTDVQLSDAPDVRSPEKTESDFARRLSEGHRLIEVPLTSDSEFFNLLQSELSGLAQLQDEEKQKIDDEIIDVGNALIKAVEPSSRSGRADLDKWRRIFELYLASSIFFNLSERNYGMQDFTTAQDRYNKFLSEAQKADLLRKFKRKESMDALQHFLHINRELLQNLRFQEVNQTAMIKILKKFDKRTSLNAKSNFPTNTALITPMALSKDLSQSLSQEIATRILAIIPSLDDYSCPICAELAWRPIRLQCGHIFCIRCLIRLQYEQRKFCPLCREEVVMKADSSSLDAELMEFMKTWFPAEVKAKQKMNERIALEQKFGKEAVEKMDCVVM